MKTIFICLIIVMVSLVNVYSEEDYGLTTFQMNEINKKSKSANALIVSGAVATVLGAVMVGTWVAEDDSVVVSPTSTTRDTVAKSPVRLISGTILGVTGLALEVGGIIRKIKAKKLKNQFIENNKAEGKISLYIKPNGAQLIYHF